MILVIFNGNIRGEDMESVIAKIVELDKQAQSIKEKIKEMEDTNSQKLKGTLMELEIKIIEEAKKIGQENYQSFINEGIDCKEKVSQEAKKECEALEKVFNKKSQQLIDSAFKEIFKV